ncbi:MAG TPA: CoA transferase [Acidimicrobiia bacterium]|nr:CoA transferase [Acidimicrobiia bacterium]
MAGPLDGVRVLELSMWSFVPSAGMALAEWGAEVLKVEPPDGGDKLRGLVVSGVAASESGLAFMFEVNNRGKRSVAVDVRHPDGRELVLRLAEVCDVFLTSFLPDLRRRLGLDVDDVMARNPSIVYATGSGAGRDGPEADRGGYDLASYWARTGLALAATAPCADHPANMPVAGLGDLSTGLVLAGGIAAALVRRVRDGRGGVVDASLLGNGLWAAQTEVTAGNLLGVDRFFKRERNESSNPINATYRTADGRYLQLVMLEADRHWPDLCRRIGRPDLVDDPRFATMAARRDHAKECMAILDEVFAGRPLAEWEDALAGATGVWSVVRTAREAGQDPQARANGYVRLARAAGGEEYVAVSSPVRFNGADPGHRPAPEHGADTDAVLRDLLDLDDEQLIELKISGAVL